MLAAPKIQPFFPPQRILMGPGPSDVYPAVLAAQADGEVSLPLLAGTESSVAATKSFIATLSASARLRNRCTSTSQE